MAEFESGSSGIGSDRANNCATTNGLPTGPFLTCVTRLDQTKQVNLLTKSMYAKQLNPQGSETGGQPYSNSSPFELNEQSLMHSSISI